MSNEEKRRLNDEIQNFKESFEREQARLKETSSPQKPCRWLKQRMNYAWSVGFVCGVLISTRIND